MSQENVQIARRTVDAMERAFEAYWIAPRSLAAAVESGDLPPESEEVFANLDADVEWNTCFAGITFRGHLECAKGWDWLLEAAEYYRVTLREVTDLGGDQVLVAVERALKGKGSAIEMNSPLFSVITVRGGLLVQVDEYSNRSEALEAVGLSE